MLEYIISHFTLSNLLAILYLVVLEGVLSVDNALALAALVKSRLRNPEDQRRALRWGIVGAYGFRIVIIFAGVWLMQNFWVKWLAAAYLIYLGATELLSRKSIGDEGEIESLGIGFKFLSPLWSTILAVELMDIMFSIDSIAVALSISDKAAILISGAVLGILAMRFAAQFFIKLIERFPILEKTAFILVLMAGLKIIAELQHIHVPEGIFMLTMFVIIISSMLIRLPATRKSTTRHEIPRY